MTIKTFFTAIFAVILLSSCSSDDDNSTEISNENIPIEIKDYVNLHFPDNPILSVREEKNLGIISYEVALKDFIELEFDKDLKIVEIDSRSKLPDSVIPEAVLGYVAEHYPANFITDWQLELDYQEIGLNNDIDLIFDLDGSFVRID